MVLNIILYLVMKDCKGVFFMQMLNMFKRNRRLLFCVVWKEVMILVDGWV